MKFFSIAFSVFAVIVSAVAFLSTPAYKSPLDLIDYPNMSGSGNLVWKLAVLDCVVQANKRRVQDINTWAFFLSGNTLSTELPPADIGFVCFVAGGKDTLSYKGEYIPKYDRSIVIESGSL